MRVPTRLIARQIRQLPVLSAAVGRLCAVMEDERSDGRAIAEAVAADPGLSANFLRSANSADGALKREVSSVEHAVSIIGRDRVQEIATSVAMSGILPDRVPGYGVDAAGFSLHCVAVGKLAAHLTEALRLDVTGDPFTAGLLHDCGKLAVGTFVAEQRETILAFAQEDGTSFAEAEHQALGTDHSEVGELLAKRWKLPQSIGHTVRWHHKPAEAPKDHYLLVQVVHVADALAVETGFGLELSGMSVELDLRAQAAIGATRRDLEAALVGAFGEIQEISDGLAA